MLTKKSSFLFLLGICLITIAYSQSLSTERVNRIKAATVKVTIENNESHGTGFFIVNNGAILTCWHVIEPALIRDPITHSITGIHRIFATLNDGKIIELGIANAMLSQFNKQAVAYDFCLLGPKFPSNMIYPFLKLGAFENLKEGDEVYSCGYPKSVPAPFVSKGVVSTKYTDTSNFILTPIKTKMPRDIAYLDLTLNSGNSGGAIVRLSGSEENDEVIGIADFIINPMGANAQAMVDLLKSRSGGIFLGGIDPNLTMATLLEILNNTSTGISGCISINHFVSLFSQPVH